MKALFTPLAAILLSAGALAACGTPDGDTSASNDAVDVAMTPAQALDSAINHPRRDDDRVRDDFRNPAETLAFFGVEPGMNVAEIWPGYYAKIIAPYFKETSGSYTAVLYPEAMGERAVTRTNAFKEAYADTETFGDIQYGSFGYSDGVSLGTLAPADSLDMILTFRNVHNWMGGGYADKAFEDFYASLKPGGTLGVVEHRLPEARLQDPNGRTGYVQESYMKDLAARAGFEFVESSEVNANPRDTADHPNGVWTLPPRSRGLSEDDPGYEDFDAELYKNIGESDRATLKFRKPL